MTGRVPSKKGDQRFDAFISYSRRDTDFARALEKRLERYRPPKGLELDKSGLRVFRDEGDLTGTEYFSSIEGYLSRSDKLVLICSPRSRDSEFVNDEIRRFVELRGPEHVVPVLLDGIPNNEATPETQDQRAFPPALVEAMEMPLATPWLGWTQSGGRPDRGNWEGSWYTLLSNLLNRSREEVEQRTRKRQRQLRIAAASAVLTIMAALAGLSVWALVERSEARIAQADAESRLLAARALQPPRGDPLYALVHGISGALRASTFEAEGALLSVVEEPIVILRMAHEGPVIGNLPSPSGTSYLTLSLDGTARVTDTAQASTPVTLQAGRGNVRTGAWAPDGREVLVGGDDGVLRSWDPVTGAAGRSLEMGDAIRHAGYAADGARWLVLAGGTPSLWTREGEAVATLDGHVAGAHLVATDPGGRWIATAGQRGGEPVRVWDGATGATHRTLTLPPPGWPVVHLAFSADGGRIAVTDRGGRSMVFEVTSGTLLLDARPRTGLVPANTVEEMARASAAPLESFAELAANWAETRDMAALDSTGSLLAMGLSSEGIVEVVQVPTGDSVARAGAHRAALVDLAFSPDGQSILTASEDGTARVWDARSGQEVERYGGHERAVRRAAFGPYGRWVATASDDYTARVWELRRAHRQVTILEDREGWLGGLPGNGGLAFTRDGRRVAILSHGAMQVWGTGVGESLLDFRPDSARSLHRASHFDPRGDHLAVLWHGGRVDWLSVRENRRLSSFTNPEGIDWHRLRVSPDEASPLVAVVGDSVTRVVDPVSGEERVTVPTLNLRDSVPALVAVRLDVAMFSPDGGTLATMEGRTAGLWDLGSSTRLATLSLPERHRGGRLVHTLAFSEDGERIVVAGDSAVQIFQVSSGAAVSPPMSDDRGILTARLSPSGDRLVAGLDDFTAVIWEVETGALLHRLEGHTSNVTSADWDPDGEHLVTFAPGEGAVRLWDAATGGAQARFSGPPGDSIVGAWYRPEDGRLVLGSRDAAARVLRTDRCPLLELGMWRRPVHFTDDLWAEILNGLPVPAWPEDDCPDGPSREAPGSP